MTTESRRERDEAMLALVLDQPEPAPGPRPGLDELWDWHAGKIKGERAVQIKAHVARDAEVYAAWREIRLALAESERADNTTAVAVDRGRSWWVRFRDWLFPDGFGGGLAVAATAAGVAVMVGILMSHPSLEDLVDDQYREWGTTGEGVAPWPRGGVDGGNKSKGGLGTGPVAASPETDAFAYGIGEGLQERHAPVVSGPQGQSLPNAMPTCAQGSDRRCQDRLEALRLLGRLLIGAHLSCRKDGQVALSGETIDRFVETLGDDDKAARFVPVLKSLQNATDGDAECGRVLGVIERGFPE